MIDFKLLVMSIWPLYNIIIAIWGITVLKHTCEQASSLFLYLRILLMTNLVVLTIIISMMLCYNYCYEENERIHATIPFVYTCASVISIVVTHLIRSVSSENCISGDKDTFDIITLISLCTSYVTFISGCGYFIWWLKDYSDKPARQERIKAELERDTKLAEKRKARAIQKQKDINISQQGRHEIQTRKQQLKQAKQEAENEEQAVRAAQAAREQGSARPVPILPTQQATIADLPTRKQEVTRPRTIADLSQIKTTDRQPLMDPPLYSSY